MMQQTYKDAIVPAMKEKVSHKNVFAVPRLEKIVINSGVGKIINTRKGNEVAQGEEGLVENIISELSLIAGQKPHIIKAKKSIAGFKLREGTIAGIRVTLRGGKMYDFLSRLINVSFPRIRDFRGFNTKSVDKSGNMSIGIHEQIIFAEIPHDKVRQMWGMEITIVTTADDAEKGTELLRQFGMPFVK